MSNIDKILKTALSPTKYPSEELNEIIRKQMKESGNMKMKRKSKRLIIAAAAVVLCIIIIPTSVYAAYKYLLPKEAATEMMDETLGKAFDKEGTEVLQTVTDGAFQVTFLGHVTGESISERTGSAWELQPQRTYVAVAIEKENGTDMTDDDDLSMFVSPLIQGLEPWNYNIASMNGSYMSKIIDGVLYRIIECDSVEFFADKKLYLAVSDTAFFSKDAFCYEETTGLITVEEAYQGTNILFDLKMDSSKADSEKADAYLKQLEKEWNSDEDTGKDEGTQEQGDVQQEKPGEDPRIQQEIFTDHNITFRIKDNESPASWGKEDESQTVFSYYFEVEGEDIESLTYSLEKGGEFSSYPTNKLYELESYGDQCSLTYEEQKDRGFQYSVMFSAFYEDYGYDIDYLNDLGVTDVEARNKIYNEVLNKAIESTKMKLEIKLKDGKTIEKTLSFHNVLDKEIGSGNFWIAITVE